MLHSARDADALRGSPDESDREDANAEPHALSSRSGPKDEDARGREAADDITANLSAVVEQQVEQPFAHAFEELVHAYPNGLGLFPDDALGMYIGGRHMLLMVEEPESDARGLRVEVSLRFEDQMHARKTLLFFADGRIMDDTETIPERRLLKRWEPDFSGLSTEDIAQAMLERIRARVAEQAQPKRLWRF